MIRPLPHSASVETSYVSLTDVLRQRAKDSPDKLAYQFLVDGQSEGPRLTYLDLQDGANLIAERLLAVADRGDRALLLYPPGDEFLLAFFGCLQAGVIAVPLSPPDTSRLKRALPRLTAVAADAQASLVLTTTDIRISVEDHLDGAGQLRWVNTDNLTDRDAASPIADACAATADDLAFLQYTSGSTSTPKGVMVSHGNVLSQCHALMLASGYNSSSITATWMPYFHDYGLIEGLLMPFYVGATCYYMSPLTFIRRPIRWMEAVSRYRVTHTQGPNFAYDLCNRKTTPEQRANLDLSCLVSAANGAETVHAGTIETFYALHKACGLAKDAISPAYGLAESTLVVSATPPDEEPVCFAADVQAYERGRLKVATEGAASRTFVSSGRPLAGSSVQIVNPHTRRRCAADEVGEIWVAGPSVTQGYWQQPEVTESTFHAQIADSGGGRFLRTGDLGCLLDGQLYVTGRLKELIIIRGLNHYPQDIELTVARSHPALRPSCGAAFSVDVGGEEELVVVHDIEGRAQRNLNVEEVLSAIRAAVFDEHELRLHAISLVRPGAVLKTTSGKIQRAAMKAAFELGELETVASWIATTGADDSGINTDTPTVPSLRRWIADWLATKAGQNGNTIDASSRFADCGLDSLRACELADGLAALLNRRIDPTLFWNYSTIDAAASHLLQSNGHNSNGNCDRAHGQRFKAEQSVVLVDSARRRNHADDNDAATGGIAIVGTGCRFPGESDSSEEFWKLLRNGEDAICEIPTDRWDLDEYYDDDREARGKMYARHGAFVSGIDQFDPAFFGLTPREAMEIDPQQRLLLEVVWEALENAGIAPSSLLGSETGVFVGLSSDDHALSQQRAIHPEDVDTYQVLGTARSIAAGRIAYVLDLRGPVIQLDTACSSSLVAVYQACESLLSGECDLAIAGGVSLILSPETMIALCKLNALSPSGRCYTFDASADGYVRGEGCGVVVLKRMSDAIRDGDTILAQIRSAAINHDGASNGLTAPNGVAQEQVIRRSLHKAGIDARHLTYVEAHGTGTELGDPIEVEALNNAYGKGRTKSEPLFIGSVKANIGHLEAAAGIAGMIKVVSMLRYREIPPQLNFKAPNPHIDWESMPIRVPTEISPWPEYDNRGLAAVSSFGFSGTNAHVIIEGVDRVVRHVEPRSSTLGFHILPLSAKTPESLVDLARKYVAHLISRPDQPVENLCFTAATCRDHFKHRVAVIAASREELLEKLRSYISGDQTAVLETRESKSVASTSLGGIGFLFTGQGSQYPGMGRELYESHPVFREAIDRCDELLQAEFDIPLAKLLYGNSAPTQVYNSAAYTQPALFSLQYALSQLWSSWGIRPNAVIGHSLGEYAAACAAGVFDVGAGLKLVATRGRLIDELPTVGMMAVVMADEHCVRATIADAAGRVSIASINGPDTTVISGEKADVQTALATFMKSGIESEILDTSNAGHSALIEPMLDRFREAAKQCEYAVPSIEMISNLYGKAVGDEIACSSYWARHLREPVRFAEGMAAMAATGCQTFIELGPNPHLLAMGMGCLRKVRPRPHWLPSLTKDRDACEMMLYSLGKLYVDGVTIDWRGFYRPFSYTKVTAPTYAFQREICETSARRRYSGRTPQQIESQMPRPSQIASKLQVLQSGLEDEAQLLTASLDEVALRFVVEAFGRLGFTWTPGDTLSENAIYARIPIQHRAKLDRVLGRLVERGWLAHEARRYRVNVAAPVDSANERLEVLRQELDCPECDLLQRAGNSLAEIWQGKVDPLSILFPNGALDQAMAFYSRAKILAGYNAIAGAALREAVSEFPDGDTLRVLEVGAGTGGLTTHLLPHLPEDRSEFCFTDLSPLFLRAASDRFKEFPFLQTHLLDISKPLVDQGIKPQSFDVVVAANVLHATPRLHDTLANVRKCLKPGGWLMLLEGANPPLWGDLVFTLIDGWWSFEDRELRPNYPLMRRDRWCRVLSESGFDEIAYLQDASLKDASSNTLYLASASTGLSLDASDQSNRLSRPESTATPSRAIEESNATAKVRLRELVVDISDDDGLALIVLHQAAHVMRLAPEQIDTAQPLAELGLDSLMAAELRAQLSETLAHELPLNTLQMRRSINEIVLYIRQQGDIRGSQPEARTSDPRERSLNTPRVHLTPLQPHGRDTPLFFVPAGYGDLFAFQDIAHAIGANQPVYGLQPASAKLVKTFRQMSIYRLVSAYISEIKKVQPQGPYFLSGYSAGGIIVVELARELLRQGDEVGLLVIFDPPSHVPRWLDWFYTATYRICKFTGMLAFAELTRLRPLRRLFHAFLDEGLRTHTTVSRGHHIASYPGRITHFRPHYSQSSFVSLRPVGRFWNTIAREGTEVHWIPGTHYGMLRGVGQGVVVDELHDCLQRAKARGSR